MTPIKVAKRPRRPIVAKQSKHSNKPARPPIKPLIPPPPPARGGTGAIVGLKIEEKSIERVMKSTRFTSRDIVDLVESYNDIRNVEWALELVALEEFTLK